MEKVLKLGGGRSQSTVQEISLEIKNGSSERLSYESYKTKYINGKQSGVTNVGISGVSDNPDYLLEIDEGNHLMQITARADNTSGTCTLTQDESGNKINLHLTTPEEEKEYWEIHFNPIPINGVDTSAFFATSTNINGEDGFMNEGTRYKNWIVNQNRNTINIYISPMYPGNYDMLSWSCLDKGGNAFSPNYNIPDNQYFTTKTTGLGSYTLTKVSTPSVSSGTFVLSSRFNPTKKYPLDLNFYWGAPT